MFFSGLKTDLYLKFQSMSCNFGLRVFVENYIADIFIFCRKFIYITVLYYKALVSLKFYEKFITS